MNLELLQTLSQREDKSLCKEKHMVEPLEKNINPKTALPLDFRVNEPTLVTHLQASLDWTIFTGSCLPLANEEMTEKNIAKCFSSPPCGPGD